MTIDFLDKIKKQFQLTKHFETNFLLALVLCNELCLDIFACFGIFIFALIFGETFSKQNKQTNSSFSFGKIRPNLKLDRVIFSANKSFLFKKRIIDVLTNHLLLQIESNKRRDSCIRFVVSSSTRTLAKSKQNHEITK